MENKTVNDIVHKSAKTFGEESDTDVGESFASYHDRANTKIQERLLCVANLLESTREGEHNYDEELLLESAYEEVYKYFGYKHMQDPQQGDYMDFTDSNDNYGAFYTGFEEKYEKDLAAVKKINMEEYAKFLARLSVTSSEFDAMYINAVKSSLRFVQEVRTAKASDWMSKLGIDRETKLLDFLGL